MRANPWLYPAVEIVHIAGFALLVGAVAMFDLRVLGFGRALPVPALARYLLPWSAGSMLAVLPSGLLLFAAEAPDLAANRVFLLKLFLIGAAGLNALAFHAGPYRSAGAGRPLRRRAHACKRCCRCSCGPACSPAEGCWRMCRHRKNRS